MRRASAVCSLVIPVIAVAQSHRGESGFLDRSVVVAGATRRYAVYVPLDFAADKTWPVLVDLHGNRARDGRSDPQP